MKEQAAGAKGTQTVRIDVAVGAERLQRTFEVPAGRTRPARLLPVFRETSHALIDASVRAASAQGRSVSCGPGCGACCAQLVPVTETEARQLAALVENLPEGERARVRGRFDAANARLEAAGLAGLLADVSRVEEGPLERAGLEYFRLGIPCPFLDDGASCGIHPERPIACREFLVSSNPAHCADPTPETIAPIVAAARASDALGRIDGQAPGRLNYWVPLVRALAWCDANPDVQPERPATELLQEFFSVLQASADEGPPAEGSARRPSRRDRRRRKR